MQEITLASLVLTDGDVVVRPASVADADTLLQWFKDPEIYRWWGGEPKAHVADLIGVQEDDDGTMWPFIVMRDKLPIGFLQVWRETDGTNGLDMFLVHEFRGLGLGARAARMIAAHLRDAGWMQITADPLVGNERAIRMWEKEKTGTIVDIGDGLSALMVFR